MPASITSVVAEPGLVSSLARPTRPEWAVTLRLRSVASESTSSEGSPVSDCCGPCTGPLESGCTKLAASVLGDFGRIAQQAAGRLVVQSALNPLLWLCAIVSIPCFILAFLAGEDRGLMWALFAMGGIPIVVACGLAVKFGISSPEKLQSEDFQLRQRSLQMLQGADDRTIIDTDAVVAIANPMLEAANDESNGGHAQ